MGWRKNVRTKLAIIAASVAAMLGGWGLLHQHPPASGTDAQPEAAAPTATATATRRTTQAEATPAPRVHTRTHVS